MSPDPRFEGGEPVSASKPAFASVPVPPAEAALLARLRAGDEAAFESLVRESTGRMLAVARRLVKSDEDARDTVQEAFIAAFRSLDRFEGGCLLSTWLHRIVVNCCLMKLRSRKRKPEESIESFLPGFLEDGHITHSASEWSEPADAALEREQLQQLVRRSIDRLPESYRTVLLLRDIEGIDTDEAAAMLEITPNAVKIRLHRARQALRGLLDPHMRKTTP